MGQQTTEASAADAGPRDARVPDKPTVDGLEDRWAQVWQEQGTYLLRPDQDPRAGLLHRHPAADRERHAARRATSSPTPTPT